MWRHILDCRLKTARLDRPFLWCRLIIMGFLRGLCVLALAMATLHQIDDRVIVTSRNSPNLINLSDSRISPPVSAGTNTELWHLKTWIYYINFINPVSKTYQLAVSYPLPAIMASWYENAFEVVLDNMAFSLTVANFQVEKWFYMEIGSKSTGCYGTFQIRGNTPTTLPIAIPRTLTQSNRLSITYHTPGSAFYNVRLK